MTDQELIDFLKGKGHSDERAAQIAGNHPDAVREEMEKSKGEADAKKETASPQDGEAETAEPDPSA